MVSKTRSEETLSIIVDLEDVTSLEGQIPETGEGSYYDTQYMIVFNFGSVVFCNTSEETEQKALDIVRQFITLSNDQVRLRPTRLQSLIDFASGPQRKPPIPETLQVRGGGAGAAALPLFNL